MKFKVTVRQRSPSGTLYELATLTLDSFSEHSGVRMTPEFAADMLIMLIEQEANRSGEVRVWIEQAG